jgi:hypothetical protein
MKKKPAKIVAALASSLVLAAWGAASVLGTQTGVLTGENDVANAIISVVVPENLDFTLDPLELRSDGGNQVAPVDYFFINKSGAPVKVTLDLAVSLAEGVSLVDDPSVLGKDDDTATDKKLFFAISGADALEEGDLSFDKTSGHSAKGTYSAAKDTLVPFDAATGKASVVFALDEAGASGSEPGALAPEGKGVGAFQFYGELNTYAMWDDGDVKVSGTYSLTPLRGSTYEGYLEESAFTGGGWGTQLKGAAYGGNPITGGSPDEPGANAPGPAYDNSGAPETETPPGPTSEPLFDEGGGA